MTSIGKKFVCVALAIVSLPAAANDKNLQEQINHLQTAISILSAGDASLMAKVAVRVWGI